MKQLRCGVIGVGYLGQFHAEKYTQLSNAELAGICDVDHKRCDEIAHKLNTKAYYDYHELLKNVDAVNIVTPTDLHHKVAKACLEAGVHVLVEKPICSTIEEAEDLVEIAKQKNLVLQVGHLERFNKVIQASEKVLKNPKFIECERLAPFQLRGTEVNVVLDLMIHDIDIIQELVKSPLKEIRASGTSVLSKQLDIVHAHLEFENGCIANVKASRVSLKPKRNLRIFQHDAYLALDLKNRRLAIHHKGENEMFPGIPEIIKEEQAFEQGDALMDEIKSFTESIQEGKQAAVTGEDGLRALKTAIEITNIVNSHTRNMV